MPDIVHVTYGRTGESTKTNSMGMREMQERAYAVRDAQLLLIKAPPASGKSRALMFIALDKLHRQGLKKVIVAVPEKSIGGSFDNTDLTSHGFFADWTVSPACNLCTPGGDRSKVAAFQRFLASEERVLICTHATLRFAFEATEESDYNNVYRREICFERRKRALSAAMRHITDLKDELLRITSRAPTVELFF